MTMTDIQLKTDLPRRREELVLSLRAAWKLNRAGGFHVAKVDNHWKSERRCKAHNLQKAGQECMSVRVKDSDLC